MLQSGKLALAIGTILIVASAGVFLTMDEVGEDFTMDEIPGKQQVDNYIEAQEEKKQSATTTKENDANGALLKQSYEIGGSCNPNLQNINLTQKDENSVRFQISTSSQEWLRFSKTEGILPDSVLVSIDCGIVQIEGIYQATSSIIVYNQSNAVVNTVPIEASIEVVAPSIYLQPDNN